MRTSRVLWNDVGVKFGIYSFPTYMLVDEEGKVLLRNAKCPSEKEELYQQITEALK